MFDHVIDGLEQHEIYEILAKPLVEKSFEGYNCTFLASGQTGSGKTFTMGFESIVRTKCVFTEFRMLNNNVLHFVID